MAILENQKQAQDNLCTIFYRPLKKPISVTPDFKLEWERMTCAHRKAAQRNNQCCCPFKKSWLCDAVCDGCEFRISNHVLSLDAEFENCKDDATSLYDITPAESQIDAEIHFDRMVLADLLDQLRQTDKQSYNILRLYDEGLSERNCAKALGMSRYMYVQLRDALIEKYREAFQK